jgi:hypothetical protein
MAVSLSIDDFGTGYSSMSYLKTLPVKELKIDRSFVMGMADDPDSAVIVRSAVDLGHNLGMTVVAEGVQDGFARRELADMGCDLVQGYQICRPVPASELELWMQTHPVTDPPPPAVHDHEDPAWPVKAAYRERAVSQATVHSRTARGSERLPCMIYVAAEDRYEEKMPYRRCGRSGIELPEVSLGLWQNFGDDRSMDTQRAILRRAFDLGVTHFDLANNYGPPYGSAEINFGRILREDLRPYRDQLIISTKAGYDMWPGPYGDRGSRKYLGQPRPVAGPDGPEYVDIFYSHRADPDTPLEETMGALATAVTWAGPCTPAISSYSPERTRRPPRSCATSVSWLLIHQPSYSLLNRWIEEELLDTLGERGSAASRSPRWPRGC